MRDMFSCIVWAAAVGSGAMAWAAQPPPAANAAPRPASAASGGAAVQGAGAVIVKVRFGKQPPGEPKQADLQIDGKPRISTTPAGERDLTSVVHGKVRLMVYVAGGDRCEVRFDVAAGKRMTVNVFVPKPQPQGGARCDRTVAVAD